MNWNEIEEERRRALPDIIQTLMAANENVRQVVERHLRALEMDREQMLLAVVRVLMLDLRHKGECLKKLLTPPQEG